MRFKFTPHDIQEIYGISCRAFISTFKYEESQKSDSDSEFNSLNSIDIYIAISMSVCYCFNHTYRKYILGRNIFCSMNKGNIWEERIFEIVHYPFEG